MEIKLTDFLKSDASNIDRGTVILDEKEIKTDFDEFTLRLNTAQDWNIERCFAEVFGEDNKDLKKFSPFDRETGFELEILRYWRESLITGSFELPLETLCRAIVSGLSLTVHHFPKYIEILEDGTEQEATGHDIQCFINIYYDKNQHKIISRPDSQLVRELVILDMQGILADFEKFIEFGINIIQAALQQLKIEAKDVEVEIMNYTSIDINSAKNAELAEKTAEAEKQLDIPSVEDLLKLLD